MASKNAFCSFCGTRFPAGQFPKTCGGCHETTWLNPIPVAVVLLPVDDGLLLVRRSIPPQIGDLALPGGFINLGENWQEAGARELLEETGIQIDPATLEVYDVRSTARPPILIFMRAPRMRAVDVPDFIPNDEVSEIVIAKDPVPLAFPTHTEMMQNFFRDAWRPPHVSR
jgi:ADP-ribose pyrophosphatase YjhB (NUDIX family)